MDLRFIALVLVASATTFGGTWWYLNRTPETERSPTADPPPLVSQSGEVLDFKDCGEVVAAGKAPLLAGRPGYKAEFDHDGDGIACPPPA
ncbi:excalibur calcium-binding domain-containing protein [Sphingomonas rhizophila]|uniref:Excalibur calcium-binding domain-containing protein n=1 Tax=Sphingomonas rhizophila TaxID=2071607 RepID=A0A7G9SBW1_9SPHN|nr:excalibur calcium-binding domain-containing protein [Sphingomonas rhizophila]QNN65336.1 excalibur calcium-binding domain-containing protein [Sphingomonas rhizophila]